MPVGPVPDLVSRMVIHGEDRSEGDCDEPGYDTYEGGFGEDAMAIFAAVQIIPQLAFGIQLGSGL